MRNTPHGAFTEQAAKVLDSMAHSTISNYAIPGLHSSLIGSGLAGKVRMFTCDRNHQENITPHSHRFDFACHVLAGNVTNKVWFEDENGDEFMLSRLMYEGAPGDYERDGGRVGRFLHVVEFYRLGDWYSMRAEQIHSIEFSRGARVLFFEGPEKATSSVILEPYINGFCIPTLHTEPWMFQRNATVVDHG